MKTVFYYMPGLFVFFLFVFCNVNKGPLNSKYDGIANRDVVGFIDYGCLKEENVLSKADMDTRIYLRDYWTSADTLTLQIHYTANCCPGFVVDIDVKENVVEIAIADTLRSCLCFCEYNNDFSFLYDEKGVLRVLFKWWDITHTLLTMEMDTTIIVTGLES